MDEMERLLGLMDRVEQDYARRLEGREPTQGTRSASTITVNAGGTGVWLAAWIASICCTACLVAMAFGLAWMLHQAKEIDDLNAYLQAIYQQAPSLQPPKDTQP